MAVLLKSGTVYKCSATPVGSAVIHVVSGSINLLGSNVTKYTKKKRLIKPKIDELVSTGDELKAGIHLLAGLPEWIAFQEDAEVWVRMVAEPTDAIDADEAEGD